MKTDTFNKGGKGHHSDPVPSPYHLQTLLNASMPAGLGFFSPLASDYFLKSLTSLPEGKCRRAIEVSVSQKQRRWQQEASVAWGSCNHLNRNYSMVVHGGEKTCKEKRKKTKHMETSAAKGHWKNSFVLMWEAHQPPVLHTMRCAINRR